jgi:hypothetical protein
MFEIRLRVRGKKQAPMQVRGQKNKVFVLVYKAKAC